MTMSASVQTKAKRARVMPDIVRQIAGEILSGRLAPGATLPIESDMCIRYAVSRTVVREALKVLAAKGFVLSRPRIGTVVCAAEEWNLLDPQVMEWHGPELFDRSLLDAMLETRRAFEPFVAGLAAQRSSLQELGALEASLQGMVDAGSDDAAFSLADIEFHRTLHRAAHNPFLLRIGMLIDAALKYSIETTAASTLEKRAEAVARHGAVVEALRMRDSAAAEAATLQIIEQAAADIELTASRRSPNSTS